MTADDVRELLAALDRMNDIAGDGVTRDGEIIRAIREEIYPHIRPLAESWLAQQARIARALEMHSEFEDTLLNKWFCRQCSAQHPCPTRRALLGEEATK